MRKISSYILICSTLIAMCCNYFDKDNSNTQNSEGIKIVFAGDVLLDRGVRNTIKRRGVKWLFQDVEPYFHNADFTIVNLECPITQIYAPLMKKFIFRADDSCAKVLAEVGITHCAIANNHVMDQGSKAIAETVENLKQNNIISIGYGYNDSVRSSPTIITKNNITIAIFNTCDFYIENYLSSENLPGICNLSIETILPKIEKYHSENPTHKIIAVLHWGIEFSKHPTIKSKMYAKNLFAIGVDVIIGHHPHVTQDIDTINGKLVYYSIGNFVFDQKNPEGRKAYMPILTITNDTITHEVYNIQIEENRPKIKHKLKPY